MTELATFSIKPDMKDEWNLGLEKNTDPYGRAVYVYAARWASYMEENIKNGKAIPDIAKPLSHAADIEGITGFMYGCAVNILSRVWEHGEEFRRWHNLDTQIMDEGEKANEDGGVLNPAVLNIG